MTTKYHVLLKDDQEQWFSVSDIPFETQSIFEMFTTASTWLDENDEIRITLENGDNWSICECLNDPTYSDAKLKW